jgi:hypothetical protein
MNKSATLIVLSTLAALATFASSAARADSPDPSGQFALKAQSQSSRAQVVSEAIRAVRLGQIHYGEAATQESAAGSTQAGLSQDSVREQTAQAVRLGQIRYGEQSL